MRHRRETPEPSSMRSLFALARTVLPMTAAAACVLLLAVALTGCAGGRTVPADAA